ncbi:hypothetical protein [Methanolobus sp. ZRKC5]|uniref:hypothetical protein n=1 Tax=unclassified Methanolobus TaxID=2629569 RepID=UPI00313C2876
MTRDFTLDAYLQLLECIKETNYSCKNVRDYTYKSSGKCIILRHDVDRDIKRALDMAELEYNCDISSTYYFRHTKDVFVPEAMKKVEDMGHEVGFHYEVLDKSHGDYGKGIAIFENELNEFRKFVVVDTICMHGNPFAHWSNKDIWNEYDFESYGLIAEPYLSLDYSKIFYMTDTGRSWGNIASRVKDVVDSSFNSQVLNEFGPVNSTTDLIKLIKSQKVSQICILSHPNRWCNDIKGWSKELVTQKIKNVGKRLIVQYRQINTFNQ